MCAMLTQQEGSLQCVSRDLREGYSATSPDGTSISSTTRAVTLCEILHLHHVGEILNLAGVRHSARIRLRFERAD